MRLVCWSKNYCCIPFQQLFKNCPSDVYQVSHYNINYKWNWSFFMFLSYFISSHSNHLFTNFTHLACFLWHCLYFFFIYKNFLHIKDIGSLFVAVCQIFFSVRSLSLGSVIPSFLPPYFPTPSFLPFFPCTYRGSTF